MKEGSEFPVISFFELNWFSLHESVSSTPSQPNTLQTHEYA